MMDNQTETIDASLIDLDLLSTDKLLQVLLDSQQNAVAAVRNASQELEVAVSMSASRLMHGGGRLVLAGAGASGRLAIQDGAELWPTFGWPHERLKLCMAGGFDALLSSLEGAEDDGDAAISEIRDSKIDQHDVVIAIAASGRSPWTCSLLEQSRKQGALTIGIANNADTPLLSIAECPLWLGTGAEVLAGSTRMAAGTAQKIALNAFSTALMSRLNRTYGNLMVDMAAVNEKLNIRRIKLLQGVLPQLDEDQAQVALAKAGGWVKLAALVALGDSVEVGKSRLHECDGSLRRAMQLVREPD
jgi:N-acetylmuramic acid 6-phosphate etherase